ncbi:hypothetical protein EC988_003414 [Linderina pennispora]|nr:hypothetical protein EC988_003414 [Linderina pennispora]
MAGPGVNGHKGGEARVSNPTKEAWILQSLRKRRSEFLSTSTIQAFVGTWNVNGQAAAGVEELTEWLGFVPPANAPVVVTELPELLVLGFQELDVRAEAFVYNNAVKDGEWTQAVERSLGETRYSYAKLASKQLIGMFIMVYARIDVMDEIVDVQAASIGCGIMGMVGNKGAVAVHLVFRHTPICLVCSHLAHDALQLEKRNAQFHDLCKRLTFSSTEGVPAADPLVPASQQSVTGTGAAVGRPLTVFDHSYLLWFGDLNYRLAVDTGDSEEYIARHEYEAILGLDQLKISILNKQAFVGFEEAKVDFAPTYKYVIGTGEYDAKRRPAWCDRILWWTRPGCDGGVRSLSYESVPSLSISDHKPVRSRLELDVWKVQEEKRQAVFLEVLRELDRYENECIPLATLDSSIVDFGYVHYGKPAKATLKLANTGQVPLEFGFISTPARERSAPEWLRISPESGMLLPGEHINMEFSVFVDSATAMPLSTRIDELNDILILHLNRGRDYFIQVQGDYMSSVFGMSMDVLVHCKRPVRLMSREDFEACLGSGQYSVPVCIWTLTDFLTRFGIDRGYSLFYWKGDSELAWSVRECLDTGEKLNPDRILQWQGEAEDHVARTASEPVGLTRGNTANLSLTDQTLVSSSAMQSALSGFALSSVPSTAEALERLTLNPWSAISPAQSHQYEPEATEQQNEEEVRLSVSDSDSIAQDQTPMRPSLQSTGGDEALAGSPLPETIADAANIAHDVGVDTVAMVLVDLLKSLPEPLIPTEMYSACVEAGGISRAAALEAMEVLPPGNLNVVVYLLAFLREAVDQGSVSAQRVASVFSTVLLRAPRERYQTPGDNEKAENFVSFLLRSHGEI